MLPAVAAVVDGGGAAARSLFAGADADVDIAAYHSLTPLWPPQAPFFSGADEYVPSLQIPVVPAGASAGGAACADKTKAAEARRESVDSGFMAVSKVSGDAGL